MRVAPGKFLYLRYERLGGVGMMVVLEIASSFPGGKYQVVRVGALYFWRYSQHGNYYGVNYGGTSISEAIDDVRSWARQHCDEAV